MFLWILNESDAIAIRIIMHNIHDIFMTFNNNLAVYAESKHKTAYI